MKTSSIGTQIIEEVIKQGMMRVAHPDPDEAHVFVWRENSADQLDALIANSGNVQIPSRVMALYSEALSLLGAPDNGDPQELIAWAKEAGDKLKRPT